MLQLSFRRPIAIYFQPGGPLFPPTPVFLRSVSGTSIPILPLSCLWMRLLVTSLSSLLLELFGQRQVEINLPHKPWHSPLLKSDLRMFFFTLLLERLVTPLAWAQFLVQHVSRFWPPNEKVDPLMFRSPGAKGSWMHPDIQLIWLGTSSEMVIGFVKSFVCGDIFLFYLYTY